MIKALQIALIFLLLLACNKELFSVEWSGSCWAVYTLQNPTFNFRNQIQNAYNTRIEQNKKMNCMICC